MAGRSSSDAKLTRLGELGRGADSDDLAGELRKLLGDKIQIISGKAAAVAAKLRCREVGTAIAEAMLRSLERPAHEDKGCTARLMYVEALESLQYAEAAPYLRGVRHVQLEGDEDVAAPFRAVCACGVARTASAIDAFRVLTDLLLDEKAPRAVAARLLGQSLASDASELLLRLRLQMGEHEPAVLEEYLGGLLRLAPDTYLPMTIEYLSGRNLDMAVAAGMALATLRDCDKALAILIEQWQGNPGGEFRELLLVPIAVTRHEKALEFLLEIIRERPASMANAALTALTCFGLRPEQTARVEACLDQRGDARLLEAWKRQSSARR